MDQNNCSIFDELKECHLPEWHYYNLPIASSINEEISTDLTRAGFIVI